MINVLLQVGPPHELMPLINSINYLAHPYEVAPISELVIQSIMQVYSEQTVKGREVQMLGVRLLDSSIKKIEDIHHKRSYGKVCGTITFFEAESNEQVKEIIKKGLENGFFLRPLGKRLYLIPPYCISENELHSVYDFLDQYFHRV